MFFPYFVAQSPLSNPTVPFRDKGAVEEIDLPAIRSMITVILSQVNQMRRHPVRLHTLCRCFASLAPIDPSYASGSHASRRLDLVQIDHEGRNKGMMCLYTMLDGDTTPSVVNLGSWNHRDFHVRGAPLNMLKGLARSFLYAETGNPPKKWIVVLDPVTKNTLSFRKPCPRKVADEVRRIDAQMYIGLCFQRSSPPIFKIVELCSILCTYRDGRAVGCDICTLDNNGDMDHKKWADRRSLHAKDPPLRTQGVSLDDSFHHDNFLCWGVCVDSEDPWTTWSNTLATKIPKRVGSPLVSILSLDMVAETLNNTALPPSLLQRPNSSNMHMCTLEGRPSICFLPKAGKCTGDFEVWMLKKGNGEFNPAAFGDPNSWFLRCSIPLKRLPRGYLGPVALWFDKLFFLHEWIEEINVCIGGRAQRRLVYYDLHSEQLLRVMLENGEDVNMDARSDVLVYGEKTLAPTCTREHRVLFYI